MTRTALCSCHCAYLQDRSVIPRTWHSLFMEMLSSSSPQQQVTVFSAALPLQSCVSVCHPAAWEFQAETSTVMLCRCHLRSSPFTEVPELPGPRATSKCIFQWGSSGLQIAGIAHRPSLPLWNDLGLSDITPCRHHVRGMLPGVPHISFLG